MAAEVAKTNPGLTFQKIKRENYPAWGFRDNIPMYPFDMAFVFMNGGMGDYICWLPAIEWLMYEATWIRGTVIVPIYFQEVMEYFMKPRMPDWKFSTYKQINEVPRINDMPFRGPVDLQRESLNATGAHLLTCGWVYFTNKEGPPPGYDRYPRFKPEDLDRMELPELARSLEPKKYVVMTTGMTTNSRRIPSGYWNTVIEHVVARGLTPVFLGKSLMETGNAFNVHTQFDQALKTNLGVDLRDKTSLLQAASIMSRAAAVVGHDNGLLHLAGCTDTPIVMGYNLASPEHRRPHRAVGRVYDVHLQPGELACNFCQSNTNFVIGYNFRECFYKDNKCLDMLFDNQGKRWKDAIDKAILDNP